MQSVSKVFLTNVSQAPLTKWCFCDIFSFPLSDVSVLIYRDGRLSFRRKPGCNTNLRELAKIFNGGGHAYAAGGNLLIGRETPVKAVNQETFDEIILHMNKKVSEWVYQ